MQIKELSMSKQFEKGRKFKLAQATKFMETITYKYLTELRIMIISLVFLFVSNEIAEETSDSIVWIISEEYCCRTSGATAWTWCCKDVVSSFLSSINRWFKKAFTWCSSIKQKFRCQKPSKPARPDDSTEDIVSPNDRQCNKAAKVIDPISRAKGDKLVPNKVKFISKTLVMKKKGFCNSYRPQISHQVFYSCILSPVEDSCHG